MTPVFQGFFLLLSVFAFHNFDLIMSDPGSLNLTTGQISLVGSNLA